MKVMPTPRKVIPGPSSDFPFPVFTAPRRVSGRPAAGNAACGAW
jgi:hypothetical protein